MSETRWVWQDDRLPPLSRRRDSNLNAGSHPHDWCNMVRWSLEFSILEFLRWWVWQDDRLPPLSRKRDSNLNAGSHPHD
ncbi:Uncharacterised protein [Serratia fonticola]|nr:Uncharacterised protein [Serratia fonticola]